ncbi:hypothetical protein E3N88_09405 [Mikania micrantha]|uniref:Transposase-associated domain-containing protein n=1 Tax=Mikania micrantha TaxID=192012 RepID=A0A5N6PIY1_9ASTR|nr:hypothetical protein E3N88_09405 [Mikania micrantha]
MAWYTDRRWMYEKIDNNGFLNSEYCDNVDLFLDFAFANDAVVDTRVNMHNETILEIKCPCYKCQNISYRDRATVQKHLYKEGFMLRYETWTEHGENSIRDVGQSSTTMEVDNDDGYKHMVLDNINDPRLSIFKHPSRRLFEKGGKDKVLTQKDRHKAHSYILLNCQELLESVWLFEKELRDSFPNYDEATIDKMKDEEFATCEMDDDDIADREHFFQENERIECTITEDLLPISFLHDDGMLEEVGDFDDEDFEYHGTHYGSSGIDSNDTVLPSFIEGNDDESIFHGAHTRRGHASQVQVPEPINREWIWIEDGEFNNQEKATRIIGVILKAMWNGSWDSWRDVPNEDRTRLFERFQGYFQWEEKWNVPICRHWEKCIAGKFPDFLRRVRNEAKETARKQGLLVGDDMLAKILGRELQPHEMWKQSHCRKGSRPMDKDLSSSSSHVSDVDSEENIEEENLVWVDERANETWAKYDGYLVEKYGDERSNHPKFDEVLWSRATGGKNKRKVYGLSCVKRLERIW